MEILGYLETINLTGPVHNEHFIPFGEKCNLQSPIAIKNVKPKAKSKTSVRKLFEYPGKMVQELTHFTHCGFLCNMALDTHCRGHICSLDTNAARHIGGWTNCI